MPSLKWSANAELIDYSDEEPRENKLRQYAYAGLIAASAILISRMALRIFYVK